MKNYRKHIDDFFREKLGRYRETPPDDVWDSLEGRLDTLKPYVPGASYRWLWHFGMVSLIAVLSVSLTKKLINNSNKEIQIAQVAPVTVPAVAESSNAQQNTSGPSQATVQPQAVLSSNAGNTSVNPNGQEAAANSSEATATKNSIAAHGDNTTFSKPANEYVRPSAHAAKNTEEISGSATTKNVTAKVGNRNTARVYSASAKVQQKDRVIYQNEYERALAEELVAYNDKAASDGGRNNDAVASADKNVYAASNTVPASNVNTAPNVVKKEIATEIKKRAMETAAQQHAGLGACGKFEFGIKGGYERGFEDGAAQKVVVSPYIKYHISSRISLMTQPGVKYAMLASRNVGTAQEYYSINQESSNINVIYHTSYAIGVHYVDSTIFHYSQSHDSIVKSKHYGGSYMEYEVPLLLNYGITKGLSIYGGVNAQYSSVTTVTENTTTFSGISRSGDVTIVTYDAPATQPSVSNLISYTGTPYTENTGTTAKKESLLRLGYMVGVSYNLDQHWLFDAVLQQSPLKSDVKNGYNVNAPLSAPYFRLSVGYKLTK